MSNTNTVPNYNFDFDKETGWRIGKLSDVEPGTRVLCLYRVSTVKQLYMTANKEADIPMQRVRCRQFAKEQGWTIVCELQEEGVSGHKVRAENRDKIQMIKEYAQEGRFDILLVFMFDRIGRIADETPFVVEWLVNHGIHVWSAEEGEQRIESHTDRLLNYIRFWQADGESQKTSIRTTNSLHILAEQGYFTGRICPYGYMLVKSGRLNKRKQEVHDLAICEEEAEVVRLIFNLAYIYGYGAQCIANHLNEQGYKNRAGNNWHPATIQGIMRNITYVGILRCGEIQSPVQENLQIVDDKIFYGVQKMLEVRSRKYQQTRSAPLNTRGNSLLAGNVFCGHCGARLCITTSGKGRRRVDGSDTVRTRYCCQTKTRTHGKCDGQTGYTVSKLDGLISAFMRDIFSRVRDVNRKDVIRKRHQSILIELNNRVKNLKRDCSKAEIQYAKLQDEIAKSLTGESTFSPEMLKAAIDSQEQKIKELTIALNEAEEQLHATEGNLTQVAEKFSDLLSWAELYENANMAAKKMIVSQIIDRVDVCKDYELKITLNISVEQFLNTIEMIA